MLKHQTWLLLTQKIQRITESLFLHIKKKSKRGDSARNWHKKEKVGAAVPRRVNKAKVSFYEMIKTYYLFLYASSSN